MNSYSLIRPALFQLDPERSHELALHSLALLGRFGPRGKPICANPVSVMGLTFPNKVGLAAGLDKNAVAIDGLAQLGFGFIEVGTLTPLPQSGNPKPRLFRLANEQAIINRMGFNNAGIDCALERIRSMRYKGILGINIGKNAVTPIERATDDYLIGLEKAYPLASYVTVNISSPNTKNLRQLQGESELDALLGALKNSQERLADQHGRYVPLVLKIAPDLDADQITQIADALKRHRIDGVIATNTTLGREGVESNPLSNEAGGLSGLPVKGKSTRVVSLLAAQLKGELPIIAAGGIFSGDDARDKIAAGASLVQLYSGFIYKGPSLVKECALALR
jgi:dihydroorotate dehydrogenase